MSTEAELVDQQRFDTAIATVRSDEDGIDRKSWLIVGHVDNKPDMIDVIEVDSKPETSLKDFQNKLQDDQVLYCLIRLTSTVDMSTTVKFIYVHWMGEKISMMKKGQFGVVHGSVEKLFNPYHLMIETSNLEDLQEDALIKRLDDSSGMTDKIVEDLTGRQNRGFTQYSTATTYKSSFKSVAPEGLLVHANDDVSAAIGEVRNDQSPSTWVLAGYEEDNINNPLGVVSKGEGDIENMQEYFKEDQILYGLYRVTDVIDDISTVKFVHICWVGENVKPMTKAKLSAHRGTIEHIFSPAHATIVTSDEKDLTQSSVLDKVMAGSGSKSFVK